ncbi:YgaP family membrane protein [Balneatrix alpica]|uniref:DUF2892 domain-containing protein n=1 Tax=Balneatrix alpica TaxID=75684 RepID=A0ABV5Z8X7_9GAMM|nr:DUF2892 domain-containing protein [Balneatrix alpica]
MQANVGGLDRGLRIVVGVALIATALMGWLPLLGWVGIVPLLTGLFRFCPFYPLLGIRTCKIRD